MLAIVVMLYVYYRSKRAMFVPVMSAGTSAIWGLGFMSLLGYNLDPLMLVLPFLISLMTARHSMQFMSRYMEEFELTGNVKQASQNIIDTMFIPGADQLVNRCAGNSAGGHSYHTGTDENRPLPARSGLIATVILSMLFTPAGAFLYP